MSEEERSRRLGYRARRKKWITAQAVLVAVMLVLALAAAVLMMVFDKTHYVNYIEKSSVDYGVHLKENDYYEEDFLGKDYAYIASLIDKVEASFDYGVVMQSESAVDFEYTYRVDSVVQIKDKFSTKVLYAPVYNEVASTTASVKDTTFNAKRTVFIDYAKYNDIASKFITTYDLEGADATLIVKMIVDVKGASDQFLAGESSSSRVSSISIPLRQDTVEIKISSSVPREEQKILSYTTKDISDLCQLIALALLGVAVILGIILWLYAFLSRNVDVTYDIKVAKLLRSYKSFIQRIRNSFDTAGYKLLLIESFDEMLAIRDTIQSPILMEENADKTCSKFYIPSGSELLYLFEIKVDDYDLIYGTDTGAAREEIDSECVIEEIVSEDEPVYEAVTVAVGAPEEAPTEVAPAEEVPVEEAPVEEAPVIEEEPTPVLVSVESDDEDAPDQLEYVNAAGERVRIACNRSFTANLIQSNSTVKGYYTELKNRFLSYKGVKARISWRNETFNRGRNQLAKLKIRGKTICLYLALDPAEFDKARYFHEATDAKCFASVPMMVRIRSDRGLARALTLIDTVMAKYEIMTLPAPEARSYAEDYPYESTASLVTRGLIKILIPGEIAKEPEAEVAPIAEAPVEEAPVVEEEPTPVLVSVESDDEDAPDQLEYVNAAGERVRIACNRSFTANLIQSNPTIKGYYTELKNRFLSYKGVKARFSWRNETFNRGRNQLAKLKIRGKTICLYLALDPAEFDKARYFHEATDAKCFASVPMMVRIRSDRGLARALTLIDTVMAKYEIMTLPAPEARSYAEDYPYESTASLVERGLIRILIPGESAKEPPAHHHSHKAASDN